MSVKRAERLFHLISVLRSGRGYTGPELATAMGVSQRTIYRDVVDLSELVPVYYDEGYRLLPEGFLANLSFSREELLALKLGVDVPPLASASPFAAAAHSAVAKIEEQLSRRFGGDALGGGETVSVDVTAHPLDAAKVRVFRKLEEAIRAARAVEFDYYTLSRGEETTRVVEPYGLTFRRHSWYMVGYCHMRRAVRVFRLDRIKSVALTARRFERPEGFSLEEFFADAWEVYASGAKVKVKLRFAERVGPIAEPALARRGKFRREAKTGSLVFGGEVPLSEEFCRWLLAFGGDVEVLAPPELREMVATSVRAAAALYRSKEKAARRRPKKKR